LLDLLRRPVLEVLEADPPPVGGPEPVRPAPFPPCEPFRVPKEARLRVVVEEIPALLGDGDVVGIRGRIVGVAGGVAIGEVVLEARRPDLVIRLWDDGEECARVVDVELVRVQLAPPVPPRAAPAVRLEEILPKRLAVRSRLAPVRDDPPMR